VCDSVDVEEEDEAEERDREQRDKEEEDGDDDDDYDERKLKKMVCFIQSAKNGLERAQTLFYDRIAFRRGKAVYDSYILNLERGAR